MSETTAALHGVSQALRRDHRRARPRLRAARRRGGRAGRPQRRRQDHPDEDACSASPGRARAGCELLGADPAADGFALRRHVGYLPESVSFHLALTGRETLAFYARLKGVDPRRLDPAFEAVGLDGAADRPVGDLLQGDAPAPRPRPGPARAPARPVSRRADQRSRPGAAPRLLCDRERARGARNDGAPRLACPYRDRGLRAPGGHRRPWRQDRRRHARRAPRHRPPAGPRPAAPRRRLLRAGWQRLADGSVATEVAPDAKIALLARLLADPAAVSDISVSEPTLDDLYTHFLRREAA